MHQDPVVSVKITPALSVVSISKVYTPAVVGAVSASTVQSHAPAVAALIVMPDVSESRVTNVAPALSLILMRTRESVVVLSLSDSSQFSAG